MKNAYLLLSFAIGLLSNLNSQTIPGYKLPGMSPTATPTSGDSVIFNGTVWVPAPPTSSGGSQTLFYLDQVPTTGDNLNLTVSPSAFGETVITKAVTSVTSPVFMQRFASTTLGLTSIPAGTWQFDVFASTNNNTGTNAVALRINKRVVQTGMTGTFTGAGPTRTFTVSGGTPFVAGDADASILLATLVETPIESAWVTGFTSSSIVTVTLTDPAFVNVSGASLDALYYHLFDTTTGDITGAAAALYSVQTTQPAFSAGVTDSIVFAAFATNSVVGSHNISLYYGGTANFTHFHSPITAPHNSLTGLNVGNFLHLTAAEYAAGFGSNSPNLVYASPASGSGIESLRALVVNDIPAPARVISCQPGLGDGLNAIPAGTYLTTTCYNDTSAIVTITGVRCFTDNNGTSTVNVTNGANTALLTGAITCSNTFAAGVQTATIGIAAGDFLKFTFVSDGTTKQSDWVVTEVK